jgi:hypothetical protein
MRKALLLFCLLPACLPSKSEVVTCTTDEECRAHGTGLRCDVDKRVCVCAGSFHEGCRNDPIYEDPDGGGLPDGRLPLSDAPVGPAIDTRATDTADIGRSIDLPEGTATDVPMVDAPAPDTNAPDAPGTCATNLDCPDPSKAFCVAGVCAGCQLAGAGACVAPTPACDLASGKCVGCTADSQCATDPAKAFCVAGSCVGCHTPGAAGCAARTDGKTVCATTGAALGQCVECGSTTDCANPAKGFCVNNACTGCTAALCAGKVDGGVSSVCAASGPAAGRCVECVANSDCKTDPAKGFCVNNACTGCTAALCAGSVDGGAAALVCAASGPAAGQCVECTSDAQCTKDPAKSFCVANACAGCQSAAVDACSTRAAAQPVCAASGTLAGQCVECGVSSDCKVATKPICTANVCGVCTDDSQCAAKLGANPGVCLGHLDGRCATDADTVYVGTIGTATCSDSAANPGSVQAPYCTAQTAVGIAKSKAKPLVVVTGALTPSSPIITSSVAIVGKSGGTITAAAAVDGLTVTSGDVYLRNLTIKGSASTSTGVGISAGAGVTLHMDTCAVKDNPGGGILLNGAAFDIKNTAVTGNGPGRTGTTVWGGVLVQSVPSSGSAKLNLVTVQANDGGGIICAGAIQGSGVLATSNTNASLGQIDSVCALGTGCASASSTCGAQSSPK